MDDLVQYFAFQGTYQASIGGTDLSKMGPMLGSPKQFLSFVLE
jgi:hypothetical protein